MPAFYLETSALVKRYRTETGSDFIQELIDGRTPAELFATSHLTTLETEATLARLFKARILTQRAYEVVHGRYLQDAADFLQLQPLQSATINGAIQVSRWHGLRSGDALHLATALILRSNLADLVVISSDADLVIASVQEGFLSWNPTETRSLQELRNQRASRLLS